MNPILGLWVNQFLIAPRSGGAQMASLGRGRSTDHATWRNHSIVPGGAKKTKVTLTQNLEQNGLNPQEYPVTRH